MVIVKNEENKCFVAICVREQTVIPILRRHSVTKKEIQLWEKRTKVQSITLVEHCSKAIITLKINGRKASDIEASINQWLSQVPSNLFKSNTFDCEKNFLIGNLFRMHMILIFSLRIQDVLANEV